MDRPFALCSSNQQPQLRALPKPPLFDLHAKKGKRKGFYHEIKKDHTNDAGEREVTFVGTIVVQLTSEVMWASIRFTLDGEKPTTSARLYRKPLELTAHHVLRAKCFKRGFASGEAALRFKHEVTSDDVSRKDVAS